MEGELSKKTEALASEIAAKATTLGEVNGLIRMLMKSALERMLDTEMDVHLGRVSLAAGNEEETKNLSESICSEAKSKRGSNRRNGHSPKSLQGEMGKLPLDIPCDRNGTFEPQLIGKHQRRLDGLDETILKHRRHTVL